MANEFSRLMRGENNRCVGCYCLDIKNIKCLKTGKDVSWEIQVNRKPENCPRR